LFASPEQEDGNGWHREIAGNARVIDLLFDPQAEI
jgi:hypothetical protein